MQRRLAWNSALAASLVLSACQAHRTASTADFNASLSSLAASDEAPAVPSSEAVDELLASDAGSLNQMIAESTQALDELFESNLAHLLEQSPEPAAAPEPSEPKSHQPAPASDSAGLSALLEEAALEQPEPQATPQLSELARDVVDALIAGLDASDRPLEDALALLGLDSLIPGAANAPLECDALSSSEMTHYQSARTLLDAIRTAADDPDAVADAAEQIAGELAADAPLRIDRVELCSRVDGFGQFTRFRGNTFLAGRRQRVIVYVELSRFGHTQLAGSADDPMYAVELTQRIEVYHEPDQVLAMATPTLSDRRISRNRFRDYYVVTAIDLPETLSVGKYGIRVTMTDLSDDSIAEAVIPLTIVADSSALTENP